MHPRPYDDTDRDSSHKTSKRQYASVGWVLQNAVVIGEPHAPFIVGYQDFRKHIYEYNGVIKPLEIAMVHPDELRLLNSTAFFFPQWWLPDDVFKWTKFDWRTHPGYTYHAWGSLHKHLKDLNPEKVMGVETSLHRLLRWYMGDQDMEVWLATKREYASFQLSLECH